MTGETVSYRVTFKLATLFLCIPKRNRADTLGWCASPADVRNCQISLLEPGPFDVGTGTASWALNIAINPAVRRTGRQEVCTVVVVFV